MVSLKDFIIKPRNKSDKLLAIIHFYMNGSVSKWEYKFNSIIFQDDKGNTVFVINDKEIINDLIVILK